MKKKRSEFNGFGVSLTHEGPIMYCFNTNKITFEELMYLEMQAFMNAKKNQHRLFKLYDTDSCGYTIVSLN